MPSRRAGEQLRRGKPTSSDVAAAAGVSRSAVSFALNNPQRISTATRERILAAARELGYPPNALARMLKAGATQSLGVLLPQRLARILEILTTPGFWWASGRCAIRRAAPCC